MIKLSSQFYLASQSPRRRNLLKQFNIPFKTFSVDTDELIIPGQSPSMTVKRLSLEKMNKARLKVKNGIILTADTIVVHNGVILGKPTSKSNAKILLKTLSDSEHFVYTGFTIHDVFTKKNLTDYEKTKVRFRKLSNEEISDYVEGGSPMDKAGGYGIQDDFGAVFVTKIVGCYYNVVGLPLSKVYTSLKEF